MNAERALKLVVYFGERYRHGGRLAADEFIDILARRGVAVSMLMRGVAGFGLKHGLRTDDSLTLSEDMPLIANAMDEHHVIEDALGEVTEALGNGLTTLERVALARRATDPVTLPHAKPPDAIKLTAYFGRARRVAGRAAHIAVTEVLRSSGADGAAAVLGVDGALLGQRRRARFVAANREVPLMVAAVGPPEVIARSLDGIGRAMPEAVVALDRTRVCILEGRRISLPPAAGGEAVGESHGMWQKLTMMENPKRGRSVWPRLLRDLRRRRMPGATTIRSIWGFHARGVPRGDSMLSLRRRVPVLTMILTPPDRAAEAWGLVDSSIEESDQVTVTAELVPHVRAFGPTR